MISLCVTVSKCSQGAWWVATGRTGQDRWAQVRTEGRSCRLEQKERFFQEIVALHYTEHRSFSRKCTGKRTCSQRSWLTIIITVNFTTTTTYSGQCQYLRLIGFSIECPQKIFRKQNSILSFSSHHRERQHFVAGGQCISPTQHDSRSSHWSDYFNQPTCQSSFAFSLVPNFIEIFNIFVFTTWLLLFNCKCFLK